MDFGMVGTQGMHQWCYTRLGECTQSDNHVPQGSAQSPILFPIYPNDIDCEITNWMLKFANDIWNCYWLCRSLNNVGQFE